MTSKSLDGCLEIHKDPRSTLHLKILKRELHQLAHISPWEIISQFLDRWPIKCTFGKFLLFTVF